MHSAARHVLRIGTRESKLARLQTDMIVQQLADRFPDLTIQIVPINTKGDKVLDRPLHSFGGTGVFVKELEEALFENTVDLVVHSLKDLPTEIPAGLHLGATLLRDDPRDVLVSKNHVPFDQLPPGSRVATSSRRRMAQLTYRRSDLNFVDIRGNVPTRLRKLDEGECDAMVLAAAGLLRLDLAERITQYFEPEICMPAAGQGALALECREKDEFIVNVLAKLNDHSTSSQTTAERAFLKKLGGGCSVPIGVLARIQHGNELTVSACVADGQKLLLDKISGGIDDAEKLGYSLADRMLAAGAKAILDAVLKQPQETISPP